MKVKICGITTLEDAFVCAVAGADLLGFNFYPPSPRYLPPEDCASITAVLREQFPHLLLTGIFVNETPTTVIKIMLQCGLDLGQCAGDETPGMIQKCGPTAFKALRPSGLNDLRTAAGTFPARIDPPAFLIDAHRPGEFGGTGITADWSLAAAMASRFPILLAGGLTPDNVAAAVFQVHPWGVDVASGVESKPGRKNPGMVKDFIAAARTSAED